MPKTFRPIRHRRGNVPFRSTAIFEDSEVPRPRPKMMLSVRSVISLTIFFFILVGLFVDIQVRPAMASASQAVALRAATEALNQALETAVAATPDNRTILHVEEDKSGNLRMAAFDFRTVSQVEMLATTDAEVELDALNRVVLPLPVSQSVGGALLSIWSPELPVRIHLIGSARCSIRMDASTVGINQTVHALYLDLTAQVQAVAPLLSRPVEVKSSVPLAYVVLNGDVPGTYVGRDRTSAHDGSAADGVFVLPPKN